ncbi:hypothetical protein BpHYR1_038925 [Brachionus plicatilis]|uniref:Uncharacterized protein n=1 Tax=Brachionus plicatilis TaxID=10195 RepID=A0A3M7S072_BRAPC|nr:hypothetical protein BpHYR1_038925 [Brachionus plicatilis]
MLKVACFSLNNEQAHGSRYRNRILGEREKKMSNNGVEFVLEDEFSVLLARITLFFFSGRRKSKKKRKKNKLKLNKTQIEFFYSRSAGKK